MSRRWIALGALGLVALSGCDAFPIHYRSPGPESGIITGNPGTGVEVSSQGSGVGKRSASGPPIDQTGTSTQVLGTGNGGVVTTPGPGRSGR